MTRPIQILLLFFLTAVFSAAAPLPTTADDMVLFKNGHTLRADELELKDGAYRITTMSGGIMEIPVQLVERVVSCVVDKEVEEQRGTVPAGAPPPPTIVRGGSQTNVTRIPPRGAVGGDDTVGKGSLGGGKAGGRKSGIPTAIPPRGTRSPGKTGAGKSAAEKGKGEGK